MPNHSENHDHHKHDPAHDEHGHSSLGHGSHRVMVLTVMAMVTSTIIVMISVRSMLVL